MRKENISYSNLSARVSEKDIKKIAELFQREYSNPPEDFCSTPRKAFNAARLMIKTLDENGRNASLVVARNAEREVVAFAFGKVYDPSFHKNVFDNKLKGNKYYHLQGIVVDPAYRRKSISTKLTSMRLAHALTRGCTHVLADTSKTNIARIKQFEKEGYEKLDDYEYEISRRKIKVTIYHRQIV